MVQQIPCPKCAAKAGESCGHRRDKSRSHHKRLTAAQEHFNKGARSMADYDDTNRGAAFPPFDTQSLILQGKLNVVGHDMKVVLVKDQTKGGTKLIEVYQKVGVLFENDKKGNDNAPDYSGPLEVGDKRIAAWRKEANGKPYMSMSLSDPQHSAGASSQAPAKKEVFDEIPF